MSGIQGEVEPAPVRRCKARTLLVAALVLLGAIVTLPVWGWGPAYYLDMERTVLSTVPSPDGGRIASVERVVVGGEPTIVVMIRDRWLPDWYLTGCVATSHYQDASADVEWVSSRMMTIRTDGEPRFWSAHSAPFHEGRCSDISATIDVVRS